MWPWRQLNTQTHSLISLVARSYRALRDYERELWETSTGLYTQHPTLTHTNKRLSILSYAEKSKSSLYKNNKNKQTSPKLHNQLMTWKAHRVHNVLLLRVSQLPAVLLLSPMWMKYELITVKLFFGNFVFSGILLLGGWSNLICQSEQPYETTRTHG